jgi:hypothetical protein
MNIRDMPPTRAAPLSHGPDETNVDRVHLQVTRDADCPSKIAGREALTKRRAQPVTCIGQYTAERTPAAVTRSISASAISGLVRAVRYSTGTPARFNRDRSLVQLSGRKRRNATITGTSSRASVSDTSVWQWAFLPSAEACCEATPTECLPLQPSHKTCVGLPNWSSDRRQQRIRVRSSWKHSIRPSRFAPSAP